MHINVKTIPHSVQRYNTIGDWWFDDNGDLQIRVSDLQNNDYESLIITHELVEALLCKKRGITADEVTHFDQTFEDMRKQFPGIVVDDEPGDSVNSPYHTEHITATALEEFMADELKVDWSKYEKAIKDL